MHEQVLGTIETFEDWIGRNLNLIVLLSVCT